MKNRHLNKDGTYNYGSKESHGNFYACNNIMCDYLNNHLKRKQKFVSSNIPIKYINYYKKHNKYVSDGTLYRGRSFIIVQSKKTFSINI